MQFEGASQLELRLSNIVKRCESELPPSTLETDIVVALSDAANELQRLRGHWPKAAETPAAMPVIRNVDRDPTIIKCHINACIAALRDEDGRSKTRKLAIAVTKLQEATMWIDEHLRIS